MKKLIALALALTLLIVPLSSAEDAVQAENSGQNAVLLQLEQKLAEAKYRFYILKNNVKSANQNIEEIETQVSTLQEALDIIDNNIKDTKDKILSVKTQIESKKMEILDTEEDIQMKELEVADQKAVVGDLMLLLYLKRGIYYDDGGVNAVKVLASEDSISETLQKVTFLNLIENENENQIMKLAKMEDGMRDKWNKLRYKRAQLSELDDELAGEMNNLKAAREGQQNLLDETKGDEAIYKAMLASADDKESQILKEIEIYQKNVDDIRRKMAGLGQELSQSEKDLIAEIQSGTSEMFSGDEAAKELNLDWPASPERGLTAFFRDSAYQATFGVDHYAVDIRANHGDPIYAPADGVVFNVVFDAESTKYAYIMVAHRMGVMTLYGHISQPNVKVGDFVKRGDIIGLTGGTPHTVGAGVRTTGPHLHFEVWQDGIRVDPLKYLSLDPIPMDNLPDEYLQILKDRLEQEIRDIQSKMD